MNEVAFGAYSTAETTMLLLSLCSSFPDFLESTTLQIAAKPLPKHECAVALNAPGRYERGSAPMLLAKTTASAEFCIPVSMDIVRAVRSEKPNACFGTKYPAEKPNE